MAKLTEGDRDRLALATVNLILEVRRMYLDRFPRSVLKHWTQIGNAVVEVTMTNASVPEWTTALLEALRLPAPSKAYSAMTLALAVVAVLLYLAIRHLVARPLQEASALAQRRQASFSKYSALPQKSQRKRRIATPERPGGVLPGPFTWTRVARPGCCAPTSRP